MIYSQEQRETKKYREEKHREKQRKNNNDSLLATERNKHGKEMCVKAWVRKQVSWETSESGNN